MYIIMKRDMGAELFRLSLYNNLLNNWQLPNPVIIMFDV